MGPDSSLNELLRDAEAHLMDGNYYRAGKISRNALALASKLPPEQPGRFDSTDRAASVLLQSLYETNRFSSARAILISSFGKMSLVPPTATLLWLSLALDTEERTQAVNLMLNFLQSGVVSDVSSGCQWSRHHFLALLHLYVIEVLLPTLRDSSEVRLWLQRQSFLPLDPREVLFLETEIESAALEKFGDGDAEKKLAKLQSKTKSSAATIAIETRDRCLNYRVDDDAGDGGDAGGGDSSLLSSPFRDIAPRLTPPFLGPPMSIPPSHSHTHHHDHQPQPPLTTAEFNRNDADGGENRDTADKEELVFELDWLGRWQHIGFRTVGNMYTRITQTLLSSSSSSLLIGKGEEKTGTTSCSDVPTQGELSPSPATVVTVTTAAIVLGYAIYSERNALKKNSLRAVHAVSHGISQLFKAGLTFY